MKEPLDYDLLEKPDSSTRLIFFVVILSICESIHLLANVEALINLHSNIELETISLLLTFISQIILSATWFVIGKIDSTYKNVLLLHIVASVLFLILYLFLI
jgi:hypothetical protein